MSQEAGGIAKILNAISSTNHTFLPLEDDSTGSPWSSADIISGGWNRDGTTNRVDWDGDNPSWTAGTNRSAGAIEVRYDGTAASDRMVIIPHTVVELSNGDTIEYTLVRIEFNTNDYPGN